MWRKPSSPPSASPSQSPPLLLVRLHGVWCVTESWQLRGWGSKSHFTDPENRCIDMKLPENTKLGRGGGYGRQAGTKFLSPCFRHPTEHELPMKYLHPSPQGSEMNWSRSVFLSLCSFQRQIFFFL